MSGGGENDAGDNNIRIDVTRDNIVNEVVEDHRGEIVVAGGNDGKNDGGGKFKTIRSFREDLRGLLKPPGTLWDQSYVGEVVTDGCHPANSSFAIGASGGLVTGLATGFFSSSRVPLPVRTPIPGSLFPRFQTTVRNSIISSSVIWRMSKRAALGAILFAVLECDFQDIVRKKEDKWKGSLAGGIVSGGIFGLRGGLPGMFIGMGVFASLTSLWEMYKQKGRDALSLG